MTKLNGSEAGIRQKERASVLDLLVCRASRDPDADFVLFRDGPHSASQLLQGAQNAGAALWSAGVRPGDRVATFLGNRREALEYWFGCMWIGAVWSPINEGYRGLQLASALETLDPKCIVSRPDHQVLLQDLKEGAWRSRLSIFSGTERLAASLERCETRHSDIAMIQFTSGSSGPSKAVQLSHGYLEGQSRIIAREYGFRADDVLYCPFPLFHWDATVGTVLAALQCGGKAALADRFSASGFWNDIRYFNATIFDFMGATLAFLKNAAPSDNDENHKVRLAWGVPMPDFKEEFEQRFGLTLIEGYGSTEGGVVVFQSPDQVFPPGSCGRPAVEYEIRICGDNDELLEPGQIGEIQSRPVSDPTLMMSGYLGMETVNARLMAGGWYRTGDLGTLDPAGNLYFRGRKKDVIRRRGENISAEEVERVLCAHPEIEDAAAYGVPSPYTEEDVAVSIVCSPGATLSSDQIRDFCIGKMATYMVPEHIMFVETLPRTDTEKVAKGDLRKNHMEQLNRETVK